MRADGMYNFMTDARIHRGTQGHFNIRRQKKQHENLPKKESAHPIINEQK